ncbi:hypothetical protein [Lacrimispora defluvii]|uniref:Uncharacterized protein n=1 Tax=Lacrimispora defluvii TaxID=2719233 RepID=A0ABX1VTA3_9FIRM|nr:hypothetical protein [Lacrimispora defluvii]NNJ30994.1 hypothetical protein [Lacrimispora defluvii]
MMSKQLTSVAKAIIIISSLVHLIFTNIHVKALLLLEHEMCGFVMFLFVLMGLVALFETTRIKKKEIAERIFTALICFVTAGLGLYLVVIYRNAISVQRSLDVGVVNRAVVFSMAIILAYVISGLMLIADSIKNR